MDSEFTDALIEAGEAAYMAKRFEEDAMNQAFLAVARVAMEHAAEVAETEVETYHEGMSAIDVRLSYSRGLKWKDGRNIAAAIRAKIPKEKSNG